MTSLQAHKLSLLLKVKTFLDQNTAVFSSFTRLNDELSNFNSILLSIKVTAQRQVINTRGIAVQKKKARQAMALTVARYARLARVWAYDTNNKQLQELFDIPKRDMLNGHGQDAINKAKNVAKGISENIGSLATYRILPANLTAINAAITEFVSVSPSPATARARHKTATESLPVLFRKAGDSLKSITDLFISE